MTIKLTICSTCGRAGSHMAATRSEGDRLADAVEAGIAARGHGPAIVRFQCLWACKSACTVLIEGVGRNGYLAGGFTPDAAAATALLDWADAYAASTDGNVPYGQWPDGMKGHFIARLPAPGGQHKGNER
ncbi:MAG TPA: DUF1636 domain-containing protein [Devosiaceae bacterium]|jgi:predicted metal-binding protein